MMCALVENSPVIFLGGQRARITERRVRRGRIQFVQQEAFSRRRSSTAARSSTPTRPTRSSTRRSGGPCPALPARPTSSIRRTSSSRSSTCRIRCRRSGIGWSTRDAAQREVAEAAKLIREAESPILLVGHGVHTSRTGAAVKELADLMACPVIQTSGGTVVHPGTGGPHVPLRVLPSGQRGSGEIRPVRRARYRARRADALRQDAPLGGQRCEPQMGATSSRIRPRSV